MPAPEPSRGPLVLLLRHGESDHNAAGLMQGACDRPRLTPLGEAQAREAAALIPSRVDALFISPLTRAAQTAAILRAARPDLPAVRTLAELREIDLPEWEGRAFADVDRDDLRRRDLWRRDPERLVMLGKDGRWIRPCQDAFARAARALARLRALPPDATALVVAHGGIIRAMMALLFGLPRARLHALGQDNATAHRLRLGPSGARLLGFGESAEPPRARVCAVLARPGPLAVLAPASVAPAIAGACGMRLAHSCETPGPGERVVVAGDGSARRAALARLADLPPSAAAALTPDGGGLHALIPAGPHGPAVVTLLDAPAEAAAGLSEEF